MKGQQTSPAARGSVVAHRFLLALLHSPIGRLLTGMCELRFVGRVSGRSIAMPVQCVREGKQLVIYVGHSSGKRWWRNFIGSHDVLVHVGGANHQGQGRVVDVGHLDTSGPNRPTEVDTRGSSCWLSIRWWSSILPPGQLTRYRVTA